MKKLPRTVWLSPETIVRLSMLAAIRGNTNSGVVEDAVAMLWLTHKDSPAPSNSKAGKALLKAAPKVIKELIDQYKEEMKK